MCLNMSHSRIFVSLIPTCFPSLVRIPFTGFELWSPKEDAPRKMLSVGMTGAVLEVQECIKLILCKLQVRMVRT